MYSAMHCLVYPKGKLVPVLLTPPALERQPLACFLPLWVFLGVEPHTGGLMYLAGYLSLTPCLHGLPRRCMDWNLLVVQVYDLAESCYVFLHRWTLQCRIIFTCKRML